jgi:hypothetical protein
MGRELVATFHDRGRSVRDSVVVRHAVIAGWTGRDAAAVEKHIAELRALGVAPPASTPIFYRVAAARLTTHDEIEVTGTASSGEVEYVLLQTGGRLWVGVGSDHTDRELETHGVTLSKQACDKPVAGEFWAYEEVAPHWDQLRLRSFIGENGSARTLYQDGAVAEMRTPDDLIRSYTEGKDLGEGTLMLCGTLAVQGGVRPAAQSTFEIEDPVLGRRIAHTYRITDLPVLG